MITIGHRGAAGLATENSFEAFELAFALNLSHIEVDIQLTRDNIPVVFHDPYLGRVTTSNEVIGNLTFDELRNSIQLENGERIPSLQELCELNCERNQTIILELKHPDSFYLVYDKIKKYDLSKYIISSFYHKQLKEVKKVNKSILTSALFECVPIDTSSFLMASECDIASISIESATRELVDEIKLLGKNCYAWTVNTRSDYEFALNLGVDGIYTNYPNLYY